MGDSDLLQRSQRASEAYDFLAESGFTGLRDVVSVSAAARAIGIPRARIYANWETAAEFSDDILARLATGPTSWLQRTVDDTSQGALEALDAAVRSDDGTAHLRATISVRPGSSSARVEVARWERARIAALAERLRTDHEGEPDAPWFEIAAAVVALVEGLLLVLPHRGAAAIDDPFGLMVGTAQRIVPFLASRSRYVGAPAASPPLADGPNHRAAAGQRVLDLAEAAFAGGQLQRDVSERRLIDMEAFARRIGVSARRLFTIWPEAADLNAALLGENVRRVQVAGMAAAMEVFVTATDHSNPTALLLRANERMLDVQRFPESMMLLRTIEVSALPSVVQAWAPTLEAMLRDWQVTAAALLQASRLRLQPGTSIASHTILSLASHIGLWRMAAMHDGVLDTRVTYLDIETRSGAAALDAHTRVHTTSTIDPTDVPDTAPADPFGRIEPR